MGAGYAFQGWWKFGGFEFLKVNLAKSYGDQEAWDKRFMLNSLAAGGAEFVADIFLCPFEAARIRQVSDPAMAKLSMPGAACDRETGRPCPRSLFRFRAYAFQADSVHHRQVRGTRFRAGEHLQGCRPSSYSLQGHEVRHL